MALLEEYRAIKTEIISIQEVARQSVSTSYVALGILAAGAGFTIENNLQGLFLIFPFLLYGLAWSQVRSTLAVQNISNHLQKHTIPRIREVLKREDNRRDYSFVMDWETHGKGVLRYYGMWAVPVAGAHYGVMILGAILSFMAYFVFPPEPPLQKWILYGLIAANVLALLYSIYVGFRTELSR
ncbi:MAG: hypothetical protein J5I90_10290 [Caldilineales bacterium]|nr:hypothetical protein [Caldilineales bacterium]